MVLSDKSANFSAILETISIIGVTAFKNASPTGTIATLRSSTDFLNFIIAESAVFPNSLSDKFARSCTDAPARSSTRAACVPSLVTFENNADKRANWNLPNICSMARALSSGASVSRACANPITVAFRSPLFLLTMLTMSMPKPCSISLALLVGLISDAKPDLSALAPSDALIPPSFMAVIKNAKSLTSPPSCWITGATFGIAVVISSRDVTVWFSTALRKLI